MLKHILTLPSLLLSANISLRGKKKMKKFFLLFASVLLIAAFISLAVANSKKSELRKYSTTVTLKITAEDEIKNQVYSYISRELRALGDVQLLEDNSVWAVKSNTEWVIQIIAMQQENKDRRIIGWVMSSVILKPILRDRDFKLFILNKALKGEYDEKLWQELFEQLRTSCIVSGHGIRSGSPEDLQSNCKDIVADFDSECLKESRKFHQQLWKQINKLREEQSAKEKDNEPKED